MSEEEYYEDEYEGAEGNYEAEESSLAAALSAQMRSAPWYMGSVLFHALLFGILLAIPHEAKEAKKRPRVIRTTIEEEPVEELEEIQPEEPEDTEVVDSDTPTEVTSVSPNVEVNMEVDISTDIDVDSDNSDADTGEEEAMGDIGMDDLGGTPVLGMSSSRSSRGGGKFGFRAAGTGRKKALRRGGGGKDTEKAVNDALCWLAEHQESDGSWDPKKFDGGAWKVGITSLGLLAFLGAGNSSRSGKFRNNVKSATEWLISQQKQNGIIGSHRYEAGIALMALSEAYGMSDDRRVKEAAEKIGEYCAKTQSKTGGWEYTPDPTGSDSSVTGWYVMGLKSAKVAGVKLDHKVYEEALKLFHYGTAANGTCFYKQKGNSPKDIRPGGNGTLGAVSLTCMQFLGKSRDDEKVVACAEQTVRQLPDPNKNDHMNYYRNYYQALGLFQMGTRSSYWIKYNPPMKTKYIKMQVKEGTYKEDKGSWPNLVDHHGKNWSRVGTTAIACLTLQVYYRYKELH